MILIGEGKTLRINPYGTTEKHLKFLRHMDGRLSKVAKLVGEIYPISCGYNEEDKMWVSPHGGPKLTEGERVPHHNYEVVQFHYDYNNGCYVCDLIEVEELTEEE